MLDLSSNLTQTVFVYLCICICVLYVRHLGTLFLRSSYHLLFKNVSHHGSFQSVSKCLILLPTNHKRVWQTVFVYLCVCMCVFGCQTLGKIVFEVLIPSAFQKYITSWVFSRGFKVPYSATHQP